MRKVLYNSIHCATGLFDELAGSLVNGSEAIKIPGFYSSNTK